jgi:L-threonylcarbamoyladenylate synthase
MTEHRTSREWSVQEGCQVVSAGGVVVYPTETLWGIGGSAWREDTVRRVCQAKGIVHLRSVPVLASDTDTVRSLLAQPIPGFEDLAAAFWPGALTVVLPVTDQQLAARAVGFRVSAHPVAQALAHACMGLLVSTSANLTGQPPPRSRVEVSSELLAGTDGLVTGDEPSHQVPSTIAKFDPKGYWQILRLGAVPLEALRAACSGCEVRG